MMRVQQVQEDMNVLMDTKKIKNNKLRNLYKKLRQPSIKNVFMQPHHCTLKSKSEQEKNIKKNNYVVSMFKNHLKIIPYFLLIIK